jgi:hypothetical protein
MWQIRVSKQGIKGGKVLIMDVALREAELIESYSHGSPWVG